MSTESLVTNKITLQTEYAGERGTFYLNGHLTSKTIPLFRRLFVSKFKEPTSDVVFNMAGVEFVDSLGLGLMIFYFTQFSESGIKFSIESPSPILRESLKLTSLDQVLRIN